MVRQLLLVPEGGLGNRMRAIAGAVALTAGMSGSVEVVWFRDPELCVSFASLFEPVCMPEVHIREAVLSDYLLYRRPRPRNLGVPQLMQRLLFRNRIYATEVIDLMSGGFDFRQWCAGGSAYLHTYSRVCDTSPQLMQKLFVPVKELRNRIEERCSGFGRYCVGVHVRRTDHDKAIAASPLELFYASMDHEVEQHPDVHFYLATDDEEVKQLMAARYGNRLQASPVQAQRNSRQGMEDALVEMYALARTQKIYGSFKSTFSQIASELGKVPIEVVANCDTNYRL